MLYSRDKGLIGKIAKDPPMVGIPIDTIISAAQPPLGLPEDIKLISEKLIH